MHLNNHELTIYFKGATEFFPTARASTISQENSSILDRFGKLVYAQEDMAVRRMTKGCKQMLAGIKTSIMRHAEASYNVIASDVGALLERKQHVFDPSNVIYIFRDREGAGRGEYAIGREYGRGVTSEGGQRTRQGGGRQHPRGE